MRVKLEPKTGTKPKVAVYVRVSTSEQADLGHSIRVQKEKMLEASENNDWVVTKIFLDEGKSARTLNRPSFDALLDYCDENSELIDGVFVQDTSRLCRNVKDHLTVKAFLEKRNIRLIALDGSNDNSAEGEFLDVIIAAVNELESKRIGKKTKRVMVSMFRDGLKPGQAPIGYINSGEKGVPMYPDEERKHFIQEVFSLWNTGNYPLKKIRDTLYEKGFRSVNGKKVSKSNIQVILKRVDYAGGLKYDGEINENAQHEAIISMEEYEKAQKISEMRNKGADRSRKHNTLLAGIAHCFKCGNLMYGEYHFDANYYKCTRCGGLYANMDAINSQVIEFFRTSVFTEKGLGNLRNVLVEVKGRIDESKPNRKQSLEARRKALDKKMSKLEDKLLYEEDFAVDKGRIREKYKPLKEQMEQVEAQLKELEKPSKNLKDSEIDKIIKAMRSMDKLYEVLDKNKKKEFLQFFIKKVYVDSSENKIVNYELVPEFEALVSRDLVRISSNWLPRLDSNQRPSA